MTRQTKNRSARIDRQAILADRPRFFDILKNHISPKQGFTGHIWRDILEPEKSILGEVDG